MDLAPFTLITIAQKYNLFLKTYKEFSKRARLVNLLEKKKNENWGEGSFIMIQITIH